MGWAKREATSGNKLITIGDAKKNHVPQCGGLLLHITCDRKYKNLRYHIQQRNGTTVEVKGSASIDRCLSETDIGRLLKMEFKGWENSQSGSAFKVIEVTVWDGRPEEKHFKLFPELKHFWPDGAEAPKVSAELLQHARAAIEESARDRDEDEPKPGSRAAKESARAKNDSYEDFPEALDEEDDDLPF